MCLPACLDLDVKADEYSNNMTCQKGCCRYRKYGSAIPSQDTGYAAKESHIVCLLSLVYIVYLYEKIQRILQNWLTNTHTEPKMAPIQARPNLYLDTYQPCISTTLGALLHGKLVNLGRLKSGLRKLARLYRKLDAFRVSDLGSEMGCEHYRRIRHSVQPDPTRGLETFLFPRRRRGLAVRHLSH